MYEDGGYSFERVLVGRLSFEKRELPRPLPEKKEIEEQVEIVLKKTVPVRF